MTAIIFILLSSILLTPTQLYPYSLQPKKMVIVFDVPGVLFKENILNLSKKIGIGSLASYSLTHWKNPATTCFNVLEKMSKQDQEKSENSTFQFKKRYMPRCIVEWQQGHKTCGQIRSEINNYIEDIAYQGYFSSTQEKDLVKRIINIIFNENQLTDLIKPTQLVNIARKLKQTGYQLFFFANMPSELFNILNTYYPSIISLFDGGLLSFQSHMLKPNKEMFKKFLQTNNLQPDQCIIIDEKEENVIAAKELGITGITYKKIPTLIQELKNLGITIQ